MLTKQQKEIIIEAMKPLKPTKIGVFGSYARNEEIEDSDIDLLYSFDNKYGYDEIYNLKELLEKKLEKKVDLVSFSYINPLLRESVLKETIMLLNIY